MSTPHPQVGGSGIEGYDDLGRDGVDERTEYGIYYLKKRGDGGVSRQFRLTECPADGCDFTWGPTDLRPWHLATHDPEDFGL